MKQRLIFHLAFLTISFNCFSQPDGGTVFVDADIITSSDSSAFESVTYKGRGDRLTFDRRINDWITVNAFLFEVVWNDELSAESVINPEFETIELAEIEAEKYGMLIGQLPYCLRLDIDEIVIHKGTQLFGGGNGGILIHTGQSILYENDGILEETLIHEACHTSLDATHAASEAWIDAQNLDGGFISDYAGEFPDREDIAESFLRWMAVRYRADKISTQYNGFITNTIPNRLTYFDEIDCNLFPFEIEAITSLNEFIEEVDILVYPNPTKDFVQLELKGEGNFQTILYNSVGDVVLSHSLRTKQKVDLSELANGVYFLVLLKEGKLIRKKIIKF